MTRTELIDRLTQRFPQLVARDAEDAVKGILGAMTDTLVCSAQTIAVESECR